MCRLGWVSESSWVRYEYSIHQFQKPEVAAAEMYDKCAIRLSTVVPSLINMYVVLRTVSQPRRWSIDEMLIWQTNLMHELCRLSRGQRTESKRRKLTMLRIKGGTSLETLFSIQPSLITHCLQARQMSSWAPVRDVWKVPNPIDVCKKIRQISRIHPLTKYTSWNV